MKHFNFFGQIEEISVSGKYNNFFIWKIVFFGIHKKFFSFEKLVFFGQV